MLGVQRSSTWDRKFDVLASVPEDKLTNLGESLLTFHDGKEVVAHQLSVLASECALTVRDEDLAFGMVSTVEENLTGIRRTGHTFLHDSQIQIG